MNHKIKKTLYTMAVYKAMELDTGLYPINHGTDYNKGYGSNGTSHYFRFNDRHKVPHTVIIKK